MEQRVSIITLGVEDLERSVRFYEAMGLERNKQITEGVAFFQMGGLILALWPREDLAADAGRPVRRAAGAGAGLPNVALAYNTRTEGEVAAVLRQAEEAGGTVIKPAQRAEWGGFQGYFTDTEGNLWEVAHNPGFPISADGSVSLPE
ncbi:VOC family protein [Nitratireductor sp. ZSWI3]|uniref:VOC family protein n=1 Tax=Nitratireductor sp. ZSWI3 TaxID=2966359 RepID=UPI0021501F33|nr:VOC family protein [Nitratireductor sp. ZSWI3]MCR4266024.1 VOC family protein [Nitratireductor sp. ZSWI3]